MLTAPLHGRFATPLSRSNYLELWWVLALTAYAFILASIALYTVVLVTRSGSGVRARASLMLIAAALPLAANMIYTQISTPLALDPTIPANSISMLLFVVGIYRSRLFSLLPGLMPQVLNREPDSGDHDVLCRYGPDQSRWLRIEVTHIPVARKSAVLLRLRDVSGEQRSKLERRHLEQQMGESRRLESLGELTGGIAHDFNNLLTVILGNATLLADALPQGSDAWHQLGHINAASLQAADLVKQMLIYAGRTPAATVPIDVSTLIKEAKLLLGRCLSEGARLTLDLATGLPPVHGDPGQLHQAIVNLVDNAGEALEDGGADDRRVHVRRRAVTVTEEEIAGAVIGSDQHHGVLAFESSPGAGSTFRIWLPTTEPT